MKHPRLSLASPRRLIGILVLAAVLLTACGGPAGESWAGLSRNPDGDALYVSFGKRVVALNPTSGAILWQYPDKSNRDANFFAVPVVAGDTIYVGDYKGRLHAVGLDGQPKWIYEPEKANAIGPFSTTPSDRVISAVAADSDLVYFGLGSRDVVAIHRDTGQKAWTFKTSHGVWAAPLYLPAGSAGTQDAATLYVVSLDHHLYAIDPVSGKQLWKLDLGGAAPGGMRYDRERGRVYVGTLTSEVIAVDLQNRSIVSRFTTDGWVWGAPALQDGVLYFGDLLGNLYAVRVTDSGFDQVWKQSVAKGAIRATPLLTDGMVVVGSKDKRVYAVSKEDGTKQWSQETKGEVLTELLLVPAADSGAGSSDLIVAGTGERDQLVIAMNTESGAESWKYADK